METVTIKRFLTRLEYQKEWVFIREVTIYSDKPVHYSFVLSP